MSVTVGIRELRANLSTYIDRARAGEEVVVTDRGKPVARLTPPRSRYDELVAAGVITPARRPRGRLPRPVPFEGDFAEFWEDFKADRV